MKAAVALPRQQNRRGSRKAFGSSTMLRVSYDSNRDRGGPTQFCGAYLLSGLLPPGQRIAEPIRPRASEDDNPLGLQGSDPRLKLLKLLNHTILLSPLCLNSLP